MVPKGSPSRGGDVAVSVFDVNEPSLPTPFYSVLVCCFCLHGPFNCIPFHIFTRQLSAFSLCSSGLISALLVVPASSRSCGGDVEIYVKDKPTELAFSFLFCSSACFCLYSPFICISFHKFSRQLSAFSLCSSGLISALLAALV